MRILLQILLFAALPGNGTPPTAYSSKFLATGRPLASLYGRRNIQPFPDRQRSASICLRSEGAKQGIMHNIDPSGTC